VTNPSMAQPARNVARYFLLVLLGVWPASSLAAQNFTPPETRQEQGSKFKIGLFGFSSRFGWDFEEDGGSIVSVALDLGNLGTEQLRLRPSAEIGFADDVDTYVVNTEILYRFTPDTERAVPYVGLGLALAGRDQCDTFPDCPGVWLQFALGFELSLRDNLSWLLEYHAEDAISRHRLFVGLASRRGR
jgi:hypothetical protein